MKALSMTALMSASSLAVCGPLVTAGGTAATPTTYEITIRKVEFKRSDSSYYTFFEGASTFDLGSSNVASGQTVGAFAAGNSLEPGTSYSAIRLTVNSSFSMAGEVASAGGAQPCRTGGAASGTAQVLGGVTMVTANATGGVGSVQTVAAPTDSGGTTVATALAAAGMEDLGGQYRMEVPLLLSVPADDTVPPALQIDFDAANALEFLTTGVGTCVVMPLPPVISVTTPSGTTTFDPASSL